MTDLAALGGDSDVDAVSRKLLPHFLAHLRLQDADIITGPSEL